MPKRVWLAIDKGEEFLRSMSPVWWTIRWCLPLLIFAILFRQLSFVGWVQIWEARPTAWIYPILLVLFCVQPIADFIIYRYLWRAEVPLGLKVFFRKRLLNSVMLEYSGEAYFFAWAAKFLKISKKTLFHAIKDSNVLSAGASLLLLWLVLLAIAIIAPVQLSTFSFAYDWLYAAVLLLPAGLCVALIVGHRRITVFGPRRIATVFAMHLFRGFVSQLLQLWLWIVSGALRSIGACLTFVLLRLLISRLPIGSSKEIIFVGAGVVAAEAMHLSVHPVAAVLVTITTSQLVFDLLLVGLPWLASRLISALLQARNSVRSVNVPPLA